MIKANLTTPYIYILGTTQDGGFPHAGCKKKCCKDAFIDPNKAKKIRSIAIVDPIDNQQWIIDASPDFKDQYFNLQKQTSLNNLSGIFLTHAHIGHYLGLAQLGKEVIDSNQLKVYTMKRMFNFLSNNGPWDQLVKNKNISLIEIKNEKKFNLNKQIDITPILVPHRDEYSETVCYLISSKEKKIIFIPDIDKWNLWNKNILEIIKEVDYALIDGTFYNNLELGRGMSEIPHPFISETMDLFKDLEKKHKKKVFFTHLNHTNPLLIENSKEQKEVRDRGYNIATDNLILEL